MGIELRTVVFETDKKLAYDRRRRHPTFKTLEERACLAKLIR
jgi:hypothetical protein